MLNSATEFDAPDLSVMLHLCVFQKYPAAVTRERFQEMIDRTKIVVEQYSGFGERFFEIVQSFFGVFDRRG